jgi:CII-binding regulator of phage lambda lysogenization HflD
LEARENNAKGIDIDLIKEWISHNTEGMLKHQELKEYRDKQLAQKEKVEAEMLEEGDRLTEALIEKEKLEFEKEELEALAKEERDEGRLLEIEDNLKDLVMAVTSITETLDMLQETLEFVQSKLNQVTEELEAFDVDSISPLSFNALESIDSAKATLKTFFQVVLDLNIYKRDLEAKCLEQDENVIQLTANLRSMEARVKFMADNGGQDGYAAHVAKQNAITTVLKQVDGFVDNRDVEHLNLNPAEQTNLTKLSLSKIVNNLKTKLKESEAKNQSISLKLDQALKQKEIYKSRCDELKSQQKNAAVQPRSRVYQGVGAKLTAHEAQNSTSPFGLHLKQTEGGESPTRSNRSSGMSFQDRQRQKRELEQQRKAAQASSKPVESLADRRKKRQNHLIDPDSVDQLGSDLDKLK